MKIPPIEAEDFERVLESFERKAFCPQFDVKKHLESQVIQ